LLPDDLAGRITRDLWWTNQEFSPVNIIPPWFTLRMNNRPGGGHSSETPQQPDRHTSDYFITYVIYITVISDDEKCAEWHHI
jgi:hypothetical protein